MKQGSINDTARLEREHNRNEITTIKATQKTQGETLHKIEMSSSRQEIKADQILKNQNGIKAQLEKNDQTATRNREWQIRREQRIDEILERETK